MLKYVDCVVGMPYSIYSSEAIILSGAFYRKVAKGDSVKEAYDFAMGQLSFQGERGSQIEINGANRRLAEYKTRGGIDAGRIYLMDSSSKAEFDKYMQYVRLGTYPYVRIPIIHIT
jgi:hypothetical protein